MAISDAEVTELATSFRLIADAIRLRDWAGLVSKDLLDPATVAGCDVEWTTFKDDLHPLSEHHIRAAIHEDPTLPLPNGGSLRVWLRMAELPDDRAYDLVAVIDVRRLEGRMECRLYDLRVP